MGGGVGGRWKKVSKLQKWAKHLKKLKKPRNGKLQMGSLAIFNFQRAFCDKRICTINHAINSLRCISFCFLRILKS